MSAPPAMQQQPGFIPAPQPAFRQLKLELHWWHHPNVILTDSASGQVVYTADTHIFSPQVVFSDAAKQRLGDASWGIVKSHIDVNINGTLFQLNRERLLLEKYSLQTSTGEQLVYNGSAWNIEVTNARGELVMEVKHHGITQRTKMVMVYGQPPMEVYLAAMALVVHWERKHEQNKR